MNDQITEPSVSVVIPVYNRNEDLKRAVSSILQQTYKDFELIIVDDGSDEPVSEALAGISDPRIIHVRHDACQGAAAARNTGVARAGGAYIAFLDSDDIWRPTKLERCIPYLCDSGATGLCTGYDIILTKGDAVETGKISTDVSMDSLVWGCNLSPGSTLVIKREALQDPMIFRTDMQRLEDWELLVRLVGSGAVIVVLDEPLSRIYSLSVPSYGSVLEGTRQMRALHGPTYRARGVRSWLKFRSTCALICASYAFHNRKMASFLWQGGLAVLFWPLRNRVFFYKAVDLVLGHRRRGRSRD